MHNWKKCSVVIVFLLLLALTAGCSEHCDNSVVAFSGYTWNVKSSEVPVGPGPNIFSNCTENVRVDDLGRLHLKITKRDDHYECAEVVVNESLGYGKYVFTVTTDPEKLNEQVVLGLFTWDDNPDYFHREIDIEFSRWENPEDMDAQFVVQPWDFPGNIYRFPVRTNGSVSTHSFEWQPDRISFLSYYGTYSSQPGEEDIIALWDYTGGNIPFPGKENARINLWLVWGKPPTDGKEAEIIIESFRFIPLP